MPKASAQFGDEFHLQRYFAVLSVTGNTRDIAATRELARKVTLHHRPHAAGPGVLRSAVSEARLCDDRLRGYGVLRAREQGSSRRSGDCASAGVRQGITSHCWLPISPLNACAEVQRAPHFAGKPIRNAVSLRPIPLALPSPPSRDKVARLADDRTGRKPAGPPRSCGRDLKRGELPARRIGFCRRTQVT
jgi:hypothetical protein